MIKLIIQSSKSTMLPPGRIFDHDIIENDFLYFSGDLTFDVIVVAGNNQYKNGRRLRLFLKPNGISTIQTLAVPTLSLTVLSTTSIRSNWSAVTGATGYQLDRSLNGTSGWTSRYSGSLLTFTDTGLTSDTHYYYRLRAVSTSVDYSAASAYDSKNATSEPAPANTVVPTITGTPTEAETLTEHDGTWTGDEIVYTYQWQKSNNGTTGWTDITGATDSTYVIENALVGKYIRVKVTGTNATGSAIGYSISTDVIASL